MPQKLDIVQFCKGIAIIMIILTHSHQMFDLPRSMQMFPMFGQMGCQMFFVLSCFCLCLSYENNTPSYVSFIYKRVKSISIGYWLTICVSLLLAKGSLMLTGSYLFKTSTNPLEVLENIFLVHGLIPVEGGNNSVVRGGWYVGTIFILYLIFPFLFCLHRKLSKKTMFPFLTFLLSFVILVGMYVYNNSFLVELNSFWYFSFINQLPGFSVGFLLYDWYRNKNSISYPGIKGWSLILMAFAIFFMPSPITYILLPFLFSLGFYYIFLWLMPAYEAIPITVKRFVRKYGDNSYAIYLIHPYLAFELSLLVISLVHISHPILFIEWLPILYLLVLVIGIQYNKLIEIIKSLVFNRKKICY